LNSTVKTALLWVVIIVLVFLLWSLFQTTKGTSETIAFSQFLDRVNSGAVESVTIRGDDVRGETKATVAGGKKEFHTTAPANYPAMIDQLRARWNPYLPAHRLNLFSPQHNNLLLQYAPGLHVNHVPSFNRHNRFRRCDLLCRKRSPQSKHQREWQHRTKEHKHLFTQMLWVRTNARAS